MSSPGENKARELDSSYPSRFPAHALGCGRISAYPQGDLVSLYLLSCLVEPSALVSDTDLVSL